MSTRWTVMTPSLRCLSSLGWTHTITIWRSSAARKACQCFPSRLMSEITRMRRAGPYSDKLSTSTRSTNWKIHPTFWSTRSAWSYLSQEKVPTPRSALNLSRTWFRSVTSINCTICSTCIRVRRISTPSCTRQRVVNRRASVFRTRCSASFSTRILRQLMTWLHSSRWLVWDSPWS